MTRRRGNPDTLSALTELLVAGYSPAEACNALRRQRVPDIPSLRTVASMAAELRPPQGTNWSVAQAAPSEAALVLPVLATVVDNSEGRITGMTRDTARWVARIAAMAPALPAHRVYQYAVRYQARGEDPLLDLELAREITKPPRRG